MADEPLHLYLWHEAGQVLVFAVATDIEDARRLVARYVVDQELTEFVARGFINQANEEPVVVSLNEPMASVHIASR